MLDGIARLFVGPSADCASRISADVAGIDCPGRPSLWRLPEKQKCRSINDKTPTVEPFFNQDAADTLRLRTA